MWQNAHNRSETSFRNRWIIYLIAAVIWVVFPSAHVSAHKVTIFAWVEGDTVYTQSKFSKGRNAKNSTVVVYDKAGNLLLEGKTDENGLFSFKVPKKTDLKVVLKASMGHLAEWTIPAEEINAVAGVSEINVQEAGVGGTAGQEASLATDDKASEQLVPTAVTLNRQEIRDIVDESLDRKLAPIVNMLADVSDRGPRMTEVIGGIGYIFGLVGVGLYFTYRRKRGSSNK